MRILLLVGALGAVAALAAATLMWGMTPTTDPRYAVLLEVLKGGITLVVVSLAGALAKFVVDQALEERRQSLSKAKEAADERKAIQRDFADIFSEFYAIRKTYHSYLDRGAELFGSTYEERTAYRRQLLERSVQLEGRYGALKLRCMDFLGIGHDSLGTKNVDELVASLQTEGDPRRRIRLQLDLLGEYYDEWRHAIQEGRKLSGATPVFALYEELLHPLRTERAVAAVAAVQSARPRAV